VRGTKKGARVMPSIKNKSNQKVWHMVSPPNETVLEDVNLTPRALFFSRSRAPRLQSGLLLKVSDFRCFVATVVELELIDESLVLAAKLAGDELHFALRAHRILERDGEL
jgi:hypothetical protein